MIGITIKVQLKSEGVPILDVKPESIVQGELKTFAILEKGMKSGKTSVSFHIELPDGTNVIAQTSAAIFDGMAGALKGAELRFSDLQKGEDHE